MKKHLYFHFVFRVCYQVLTYSPLPLTFYSHKAAHKQRGMHQDRGRTHRGRTTSHYHSEHCWRNTLLFPLRVFILSHLRLSNSFKTSVNQIHLTKFLSFYFPSFIVIFFFLFVFKQEICSTFRTRSIISFRTEH